MVRASKSWRQFLLSASLLCAESFNERKPWYPVDKISNVGGETVLIGEYFHLMLVSVL